MNNLTLKTQLYRSKTKMLGFAEDFRVRRMAKTDAQLGLVWQCKDSTWTSSNIDREIHAFQECSDRIWGKLQISTRKMYGRVDTLCEKIYQILEDTKRLNERLNIETSKVDLSLRKTGEDNLTESQINARRKREVDRSTAQLRGRMSGNLGSAEKYFDELNELRGQLIELTNTTHLICEKVKNHTLQRIDVYWNEIMKKNNGKEMNLALSTLQMNSVAEQDFLEKHKNIDEKAIRAISSYEAYVSQNENREV